MEKKIESSLSSSSPSRRLIRSWLSLILDIRKRAELDDKLKEFETYWLTEDRKRLLEKIKVDLEDLDGSNILED